MLMPPLSPPLLPLPPLPRAAFEVVHAGEMGGRALLQDSDFQG
jgi:hypothetical protein